VRRWRRSAGVLALGGDLDLRSQSVQDPGHRGSARTWCRGSGGGMTTPVTLQWCTGPSSRLVARLNKGGGPRVPLVPR
jgi:hypothetical protein